MRQRYTRETSSTRLKCRSIHKDIMLVRAKQVCHLELKSKVRRCILNGIKELADHAENVSVGKEMDVHPSSWSYVRDQPNNLGLT